MPQEIEPTEIDTDLVISHRTVTTTQDRKGMGDDDSSDPKHS